MTDQITLPPAAERSVEEIKRTLETSRSRAIDLAIAALGRGVQHPLVHQLVADGLEEDGRLSDALALLWEASTFAPENPYILNRLAQLYARMDRHDEAVETFDAAIALQPDAFHLHLARGASLLALSEPAAAREAYERAAALQPDSPEPLAALAGLCARQGDMAGARDNALKALAIRSDLASPQLILARAEIAFKQYAEAESRIRAVLADPDLPLEDQARGFGLLGDLFDATGREPLAFAAYERSGRLFQRDHDAEYRASGEDRRVQAERLLAEMTARPDVEWKGPAPRARRVRQHVFLLGFARTGTTLLEQVLASHPDVRSLEERPALDPASGRFLEGGDGLDRLATLSGEELEAERQTYWAGVAHYLDEDLSEKILIDKQPLNTVRLPLIARLFPDAKILFAVRDPRDVVLSAFRRRFRLNASMYQFLTLEGAARFYDAVMRLGEAAFERIPFDVHRVRQEDLVEDFQGQATAALKFIGLDWDPAVLRFAERARTTANTPSAAQLAEGLSRATLGAWTRYGPDMAPVLPLLEPWAARFGYAPADVADLDSQRARRGAVSLGLPMADDLRRQRNAVVAEVQALAGRGDFARAFGLAEGAIARGARHPFLYRMRGILRQQQNRLPEAIADFNAALAADPSDRGVLNAVGQTLARSGRLAEGVARLDEAIALDPTFAPAHYNRAWALENAGRLKEARQGYERAVQLDPNHAVALGNLAALAARAGDWAEARQRAEQALAIAPGLPSAVMALADADAESGRLDEAERRLKGLIAALPPEQAHEQAVAHGRLGDVLDRAGRTAEAFAQYAQRSERLKALYADRMDAPGQEPAIALTRRLRRFFEGETKADWGPAGGPEGGDCISHAFVVGFPRSGTTFLGQALATLAEVETLDEQETLLDTVQTFFNDDEALKRLTAIDPATAARFRGLYWSRVRDAGARTPGKVFVNKLPMNILGLPAIAKLFPSAKVVFLRRDPRDVVLSCYRRQFVVNPTTWSFLTLEGAATLYDEVMRLAETYERALPLDVRTLRYEDLAADLDGQMDSLCTFLGARWKGGTEGLAARAAEVATPSSSQIARGFNPEGVGAWRAYRDQLAPALPILEPWVRRFGYAAD
ncbi:MAG TPA: sulfotransferase [Caulobacteraceae bacterium]|nr:sulfotransferase [Caulobacteraceae bacterium]